MITRASAISDCSLARDLNYGAMIPTLFPKPGAAIFNTSWTK
jgi:hypothetical protein